MRSLRKTLVLLLTPLAACQAPDFPTTLDMTTWSVVAVDPVTGDVGVAMASCVPGTLADALAALVPGKGAAATQAAFDVANRNRVFEALQEGLPAEEVVRRVTDPELDTRLGSRQYAVVTMSGGVAQVAGYTGQPMLDGSENPESGRWAGIRSDASKGVSVQGNTLVNEAVVADGLTAFLWEDPVGFNTLTDRLMRALEAGSIAGGDVRCNTATSRQTAATAMIVAARGSDAPYATERIGMSDSGTDAAPWLALSVAVGRGEDNPLLELRRQYDAWRRAGGQ